MQFDVSIQKQIQLDALLSILDSEKWRKVQANLEQIETVAKTYYDETVAADKSGKYTPAGIDELRKAAARRAFQKLSAFQTQVDQLSQTITVARAGMKPRPKDQTDALISYLREMEIRRRLPLDDSVKLAEIYIKATTAGAFDVTAAIENCPYIPGLNPGQRWIVDPAIVEDNKERRRYRDNPAEAERIKELESTRSALQAFLNSAIKAIQDDSGVHFGNDAIAETAKGKQSLQ